ncbi:MAG: alkaline phosphatase PafA [Chitinophagaceae bacterium]
MPFFALLFMMLLSVPARIIAQQLPAPERPKLIVGIVIDQMRWDYLYRYAERYTQNGFRRLVNQGFSCENTFISYTPTYTAAGHAGIYTGSVPAIHGIVGNNWYERKLGRNVYCTDDSTVITVGSGSDAGKMSPRNMMTTTIGDELRLASNYESKVIGIALKDRGSILPAGHSANAAYWFDDATGGWVSSSYYMKELPKWVMQFNHKKLPDQILNTNWNTLFPIDTYTQSSADARSYENNLPGEDNGFPHITSTIKNNKYLSFRYTPSANTFTFEMAKAAVEGEELGLRNATDLLAVSLSSTDYIGHEFGPNSIEVEDTYLRLDKDIGDFISYLDRKIGRSGYLLFLSADHGVAHVPAFLKEKGVPAGVLDDEVIRELLEKTIAGQFGIRPVLKVINYQVYLDHNKLDVPGKDKDIITETIISTLLSRNEIANAYRLDRPAMINLPEKIRDRLINGYNQKRSGDIQFIYKPGYFDGGDKGTTHGTWNPYDSHIPLLWFGWKIKPGKTNREVYMADIAPTITAMLKIQMPNGCMGNVIEEVTR